MSRSIKFPTHPVVFLATAALSLWLGYHWGWRAAEQVPGEQATTVSATWTCSMHPNIQQPQAGLCPLCGMDLIQGTSGGGHQVTLTAEAQARAGIQLSPVQMRQLTRTVHAPGRLGYDPSRSWRIGALLPAEIHALHVPYAGTRLTAGTPLATLFSGDLLTGQRQYLEAVEAMGGRELDVRSAASLRLLSAKEKLVGWGMTEAQINALETRNEPSAFHVVEAPHDGIITSVQVREGQVIKSGDLLFELADDTQLWVNLDLDEDEANLVRYGQDFTFTTPALPGKQFRAQVQWIGSQLNPRTRSLPISARVSNDTGRLHHTMLVYADLTVAALAPTSTERPGRWRCPSHPDQTQAKPGTCPRCALPLAAADRFATDQWPAVLAIPASAPLLTGRRALVYVTDRQTNTAYEPREVTLGPRCGRWYPVIDGLQEGEWVVSNGNFKVDSEMQFQHQAGMMGDQAPPLQRITMAAPVTTALVQVLSTYFTAQETLSQDKDIPTLSKDLAAQAQALLNHDPGRTAPPEWTTTSQALVEAANELASRNDLNARRRAFAPVSEALRTLVSRVALPAGVVQVYCPMAFDDRGARWLQRDEVVANPYFGSAMLRCGEVQAVFEARDNGSQP